MGSLQRQETGRHSKKEKTRITHTYTHTNAHTFYRCLHGFLCFTIKNKSSHSVREAVPREDRPGPPVGVVTILPVHMLSQAIDIMGWQLGRQLKVLVIKHQRSKRCVKPATLER